MNRKILKKIAKEHGVTVEEVRRDMQEAINEAYKNPTTEAQSVPRKGDVPTPEEFIKYVADTIKKEH